MEKMLEPKQSPFAFHVAIRHGARARVRTNLGAAQEDARVLGAGAKVVPIFGAQAKRLIAADARLFAA